MFGAAADTPTYEGAETLQVIPDDDARRAAILRFVKEQLMSLPLQKRLSVYTTDPKLEEMLAKECGPLLKERLAFFGIFQIIDMERSYDPWHEVTINPQLVKCP